MLGNRRQNVDSELVGVWLSTAMNSAPESMRVAITPRGLAFRQHTWILQKIAKQVLHGRNATIFEKCVINPLLGEPKSGVEDVAGTSSHSRSSWVMPGKNPTIAPTRYQAISGDVLATKLGLPGSPFRFVALNGSRSQRRFPRAGNQRPAITR